MNVDREALLSVPIIYKWLELAEPALKFLFGRLDSMVIELRK